MFGASLMLQGCVFGTVKTRIEVPAIAMQKCEEPVKAENGRFATLFKSHVELRGQYDECRIRHNALVDRINELND